MTQKEVIAVIIAGYMPMANVKTIAEMSEKIMDALAVSSAVVPLKAELRLGKH